jgi:hypothetical protein
VLFDQRTTVGLVRLRVRQTVGDLVRVFEEMFQRDADGQQAARPLLEGADDEIDKLFGD